jgi:hypothetical protein
MHAQTIDLMGFGDVFHGAYAAALIWSVPVGGRMRFASTAAAPWRNFGARRRASEDDNRLQYAPTTLACFRGGQFAVSRIDRD